MRRDTWVPPYNRAFCRAGPACPAVSAVQARPGGQRRPGPTTQHLVGQGPCALPWVRENSGRAVEDAGPYGSATRGAMGGRPQGSPLRRGYKECDAVRNPPVTASPCQSPLGKGAKGTGMRIATGAVRPRNDSVFARNRCKAGRVVREADPYNAIHR